MDKEQVAQLAATILSGWLASDRKNLHALSSGKEESMTPIREAVDVAIKIIGEAGKAGYYPASPK